MDGRAAEVVGLPLLRRSARFETEPSAEALSALGAAETIGRPLGSAAFLARLAAPTGRDPRAKRPGPKPNAGALSKVSV